MKNLNFICMLFCISASSFAFALNSTPVPSIGTQCGTIQLHLTSGNLSGTVTEHGSAPVTIECQDVSHQPGWGTGIYLECTGGQSMSLGNNTCSPKYIVQVDLSGNVVISKDIQACYSCANYDDVFKGQCN